MKAMSHTSNHVRTKLDRANELGRACAEELCRLQRLGATKAELDVAQRKMMVPIDVLQDAAKAAWEIENGVARKRSTGPQKVVPLHDPRIRRQHAR
jgi:hypothetical protein